MFILFFYAFMEIIDKKKNQNLWNKNNISTNKNIIKNRLLLAKSTKSPQV